MFSPELQVLSEEIGKLLIAKKQVLTLAESCTGGLIAALITNTPGSSAWFDSGLVTYSNQAKQDLLKSKSDQPRTVWSSQRRGGDGDGHRRPPTRQSNDCG
jgi:nicotinamide-nucleotide amidase